MNDEHLAAMLRIADASATPPIPPPGLAGRVRARAVSRQRRRIVVISVVALVLAIVPTMFNRGAKPVATPVARALPPDVAVELARLRHEAELQSAVSIALLARERQKGVQVQSSGPQLAESLPVLRLERDRAALTLIDHGDRLGRELMQTEAAVRTYRRAIELFPNTRWAAIARKRIEQLKA